MESKKILIIDDAYFEIENLKEFFELSGFRVDVLNSFPNSNLKKFILRNIKEIRPSFIILDEMIFPSNAQTGNPSFLNVGFSLINTINRLRIPFIIYTKKPAKSIIIIKKFKYLIGIYNKLEVDSENLLSIIKRSLC